MNSSSSIFHYQGDSGKYSFLYNQGSFVTISLFIKAGSMNDNSKTGVAHFLEHMLFNNINFNSFLSINGISYNASTSKNYTLYTFFCFYKLIYILLDKILFNLDNFTIAKDLFEKEKLVIIDEFYKDTTDNSNLIYLYPNDNKKKFISNIGLLDDIKSINIDDLINFKNEFYKELHFIISGKINISNLINKYNLIHFNSISSNNLSISPINAEQNINKTCIIYENKICDDDYADITLVFKNNQHTYEFNKFLKLLLSDLLYQLLRVELAVTYKVNINYKLNNRIIEINYTCRNDDIEKTIFSILNTLKNKDLIPFYNICYKKLYFELLYELENKILSHNDYHKMMCNYIINGIEFYNINNYYNEINNLTFDKFKKFFDKIFNNNFLINIKTSNYTRVNLGIGITSSIT